MITFVTTNETSEYSHTSITYYPKDMTLQQLEYIVAVYQTRHFAKAASNCGVTQPTLSMMIQKLEQELDVKLFERNSQQVLPTPIGKKVVEQAWKVLTRAKRIKEIINEERQSIEGSFRIGILPTIAPYLLPRFFPKMVNEHPHLQLHITEMKTTEIKRALAHDLIDAAVVVRIEDLEQYDTLSLFFEQFMAYVSPESSLFSNMNIKTSDLTTQSLWLLEEGHCFRDQLVKFCNIKTATDSQSTYHLGSIETFMRMVESGQGITFIPELAVEQLTEKQRLLVRPFALPIPTREVVLISNKSFIRTHLLNYLADTIRTSVPPRMLSFNNTEQRV